MGIIGLGRIGKQVAEICRALRMKIYYYDEVRCGKAEENLGAKFTSLEKLLKECDYISLHVPLNEKTRHLLGSKELKLIKKDAYLINTSRGAVIEEKALINVLKEGAIAGAGLDVFEEEPLPEDHPLLKLNNLIVTPHMAAHTEEALLREAPRKALSNKPPPLGGGS